jgi:molybdopterin molybdotransferase
MTDKTTPGVLPFEQARKLVEQHARQLAPCGTEIVPLLDAAGRVLATAITADRDFPPFPRSTRDGYAVRAEDVADLPTTLRVVAEIRAGAAPIPAGEGANETSAELELKRGEAAEIMTGAPVPHGADAVVMVEYTRREGNRVTVQRRVEPGENVVARGTEARAGDVLLAAGHRIDYAAIAVAASVGRNEVEVYRRPRVAVLATGDEIVPITEAPGPNQIRNSNTYSLAAQVRAAGAEPVLLPIAPDEPQRLRELLQQGLAADLLLITGGVSMGKYDLVEQTLAAFDAELFFTGAQIQPGKPVVFGRAKPSTFFLGLPGNPVSTMVTFELFARPMIDALSGAPVHRIQFFQAKLKADIHVKTGLTRFLPAIMTAEYHNCWVELVPWKGSGDIAAQARANCYVVVPRDREHIFAEDVVDVMPR